MSRNAAADGDGQPAAVACAAPHAPSARPLPAPADGMVIAAVSVATEKETAAESDESGAGKEQLGLFHGLEKITAENATSPARMPRAPMR
jgi:hypothetical protein